MAETIMPPGSPPQIPGPYGPAAYPSAMPPYGGPPAFEATPLNESRLLLEYLRVLGKNKGVLCLLTAVGLLMGLVVSFVQKPVFQSRAAMEIQGLNGDFLNLKSFDPTTAFQDYSPEAEILTQARIMESDALLERVAEAVKSRGSRKGAVSDDALAYVSGHLDVRLVPGTHIVELLCDSPDKQLAADFANAWAQQYINENLESRVRITQQTEDALRGQLAEVKARLEKAEEELLAYARRSNLMFTGDDQGSVAEEKLRQTQRALSEAEKERIGKQSEFEMMAAAPPESIPEFVDDPTAHDDQTKLAEMRSQLAELRTYMAPGHSKVIRLEAQITELEAAMRGQRARLAKRIGNEYEAVRRREGLLRSNYDSQAALVAEQAQKTIRYNILKRDAETNRALYESLLQKVKEAGVAKAMRANNVRLVDAARIPGFPYKPRILPNAVMGLMAGLFLGIAVVTIRERADHNIRSPGESPVCLKLPELGAIPSGEAGANLPALLIAARSPNGEVRVPRNGSRRTADDTRPIAGGIQKSSVVAESFRATLASLLFSPRNDVHCRGIVITSAGPGEGKSTIISNLGLAMAETDRRVLLIDADLRSPRLHEIFCIPNGEGLTGLLRADKPSAEFAASHFFRVRSDSGLYVLPAGSAGENISHLLYSARLPKLLQLFRDEFDAVLIDTPPMLQAPDARILGRAAGAVVLVIRAGQTSRDTAAAAKQRLSEDGTPVIGTILNDWDVQGAAGSASRKYYGGNGHSGKNGKGR